MDTIRLSFDGSSRAREFPSIPLTILREVMERSAAPG
jgi:hypothetical protein